MDKICKRSELLRAAQELIALNGFHGAPTALIAERANVAAGTMYRYFESKDALILEVFRHLEERFSRSIMEAYPADRPLRERFIHIGKIFIHHCLTFPMDFRFLEQFHNSPYGVVHRRDKLLAEHGSDIMRELFDEARRRQVTKDLPNPILFALAFGPLLDIIRDHILGFIALDETLIESTMDACWDAVKFAGED